MGVTHTCLMGGAPPGGVEIRGTRSVFASWWAVVTGPGRTRSRRVHTIRATSGSALNLCGRVLLGQHRDNLNSPARLSGAE